MILELIAVLVLVYVVGIEVQLLAIGVISLRQLRHDRYLARYGALDEMLSSDTSPPVSIIVPAYNEAAGIVEAVRSMTMLRYPRFEIVVVNDGSTDDTLEVLIDAFRLIAVTVPHRNDLPSEPIKAIYRSTLPLHITVVDKHNGGKTDALNAGVNVARYPYVMLTDADVVLDGECLLRAMRHVVEDRERTVAVGGNIRPINGCVVNRGRVVEARLPKKTIERVQVLEYIRSFIAARPGWSWLGALVLVSGAFGVYRRDILAETGGFRKGHLGEDLDLTMRIHKLMRDKRRPYRIVFAADAVAWTEVPTTRDVLRTQRIRWHKGLRMVVRDYWKLLFNPRYGTLGMLGWPAYVAFEFLAPAVEFAGWVIVPVAFLTGNIDPQVAIPLTLTAFFLGALNSLIALFFDEGYGYFNSPLEALELLWLIYVENLGLRQRTVVWRVRAMLGPPTQAWGDMQRRGVNNLAA